MSQVQVHYMDRKGAGCMRVFATEVELERFVSALRRPAVIYREGREIGRIWDGDADDRRVRWLWSFERWEGATS